MFAHKLYLSLTTLKNFFELRTGNRVVISCADWVKIIVHCKDSTSVIPRELFLNGLCN